MKIAILESIVMPAGHEVEFDRILVDELKRQGHEPIFFVPEKFHFKMDYQTDIEYLSGGEIITYAGASKPKRIWLSIMRERRRLKWFNSAYEKINSTLDAIIIPTATYRYLRTLQKSKLKNSSVPVYFIFHGINPQEIDRFIKQAKQCEKYKNIYLKVITLRDDFHNICLSNLTLILPPVYKPLDFSVNIAPTHHESNKPIKIGFFGQFRREKNLGFFLEAFIKAKFNTSVKLIVQGATTRTEDDTAFKEYMLRYKNSSDIEFWHKSLIGKEWQQALLEVDIIVMPYAAKRYLYHWGAMLFTAIGFYKPVLVSPEINPEVLEEFNIGEAIDFSSLEVFSKQLENFVNNFSGNIDTYNKNLISANAKYSHENLIKSIIKGCK
jgi:glycosyltransferase involved in cell wall biosynthesis